MMADGVVRSIVSLLCFHLFTKLQGSVWVRPFSKAINPAVVDERKQQNSNMGMVFGKTGVAEPAYKVLATVNSSGTTTTLPYEIRQYGQRFVAETEYTTGPGSKDSTSSPFRLLARYIGVFGEAENEGGTKMSMTAPVSMKEESSGQGGGTKIAMTAPVSMKEQRPATTATATATRRSCNSFSRTITRASKTFPFPPTRPSTFEPSRARRGPSTALRGPWTRTAPAHWPCSSERSCEESVWATSRRRAQQRRPSVTTTCWSTTSTGATIRPLRCPCFGGTRFGWNWMRRRSSIW